MSQDRPLRVIQWATGSVGRHAIAAMAEHPGLELAGVWVHSESKEGVDAGEIAGIEAQGVAATRDKDALLALDADCVLYAPLLADTDEMCRILEAGKNVVTPTGFSFIKDPALAARYGDRVPVLVAGDEEICAGHCDPAHIEAFLKTR